MKEKAIYSVEYENPNEKYLLTLDVMGLKVVYKYCGSLFHNVSLLGEYLFTFGIRKK